MATKKILRCEYWLRDFWNEDEARAMLHLDGRQHDGHWAIIKSDKNVQIYGGSNYYRPELYQAMKDHPVVEKK